MGLAADLGFDKSSSSADQFQASSSTMGLMPQTGFDEWLQSLYQTEMSGGPKADKEYQSLISQQQKQEASLATAKNQLAAVKRANQPAWTKYWEKVVQNRQDALNILNDKVKVYEPAYKADVAERQTGIDQSRDAIIKYLTDQADLVPGAMREQAGIQSGTLDKLIQQGLSKEGYLPGFGDLLKSLTTGGTDISFGGQPVMENYLSPGKASALQAILDANAAMPGMLGDLAQTRSNINVAPAEEAYKYGYAPLEQKLNFAQSPDATAFGNITNQFKNQLELPNLLRYLSGGLESFGTGTGHSSADAMSANASGVMDDKGAGSILSMFGLG
jgi:hypothetical protein